MANVLQSQIRHAEPKGGFVMIRSKSILRTLIAIVALVGVGCSLLLDARAALAAERLVWFGTYTGQGTNSEGIYVSKFNDETGELSEAKLAGKATTPSFIALHPTLPMLYSTAEFVGKIEAFNLDESTGMLTPKNGQRVWASHVSVDPTGQVLLAAGGGVTCLGIAADGTLKPVANGKPSGALEHPKGGKGQKSMPHSIYPVAEGKFAIACDMNFNTVFVHALDVEKATLQLHGSTVLKAGVGPRHFAMHPGGKFGYSVNQKDSTVTGFSFDSQQGALTEIQTISTLPEDFKDKSKNATAEIAFHPSGKFAYASNRGHDSIAMYQWDGATGKLTFLGAEPIRGKEPRNFAIAPGGNFLLVAGQHSANVAVFAIDPSTGKLRYTDRSVAVPSPTCIRFRPAR
jgi:6-phosphogluconolactonase